MQALTTDDWIKILAIAVPILLVVSSALFSRLAGATYQKQLSDLNTLLKSGLDEQRAINKTKDDDLSSMKESQAGLEKKSRVRMHRLKTRLDAEVTKRDTQIATLQKERSDLQDKLTASQSLSASELHTLKIQIDENGKEIAALQAENKTQKAQILALETEQVNQRTIAMEKDIQINCAAKFFKDLGLNDAQSAAIFAGELTYQEVVVELRRKLFTTKPLVSLDESINVDNQKDTLHVEVANRETVVSAAE